MLHFYGIMIIAYKYDALCVFKCTAAPKVQYYAETSIIASEKPILFGTVVYHGASD